MICGSNIAARIYDPMRSRREKVVKKRRQPRLVKVREDAKRGAVVRNRGNVDHLMPETLESSKTMTVHV